MTEYVRNAWYGWLDYTDQGKLAALLLAALLFLWLGAKAAGHRQRGLLVYSTVMTACCICPVTAAALMWYQTKFYDYHWVWSLVPVTVVIAWGLTLVLAEQWKDFRLAAWRGGLPVTLLLAAILLLCGSMGRQVAEGKKERQDRRQAAAVLEQVSGLVPEGGICLWAPRKVMEYAREVDPAIRLFYGRNLWEASLNAYAYDRYPQEMEDIYVWMEWAVWGVVEMEDSRQGTGQITGEECTLAARGAGVNCILLPEAATGEVADRLSELFGGTVMQLEGYYLLTNTAE